MKSLHSEGHPERFTELHEEEKREEGERGDQEEPVINSLCALHSLEHSERFMEFYREEKREKADRGDQEERWVSQKERDQSSL